MVDSGLLSGLSYEKPDRQLYHRALAQQVGLPLTILDERAIATLADCCRAIDCGTGTLSFGEFCDASSDRLENLLSVYMDLAGRRAVPQNHYPHPLFRHMKDHLCVRLFECVHLSRAAQQIHEGEIRDSSFVLESCQFETFVTRAGQSLVMIGPLFTEAGLGEGMARMHYSLMKAELEKFNSDVRRFWSSHETALAGQRDAAIYTVDYLRNVSFQRSRRLRALVEDRLGLVCRLLSRFEEVEVACMDPPFSPRAVIKSIAALSAVDEIGVDGVFHTKRFTSGASEPVVIGVSKSELVDSAAPSTTLVAYDFAYARNMETAFANWAASLSESLTRLSHWLLSSQTVDEHADASQRQTFGRRLARFLASAFEAFECTIYSVSHDRGADRLTVFGSFSADPKGDERLADMDRHMNAIVGTAQEVDSISFRCLRENSVQYCQAYDYKGAGAMPARQRITFPKNSSFEFWGRSACAIPIRVNGIMWGVLQLIGRRPHAFPEFIRARAEDACDIIGSHLFRTELIDSVHGIMRTMSAHDLGTGEKKSAVERALSRMFGSRTFAILRPDPANPENASVFLQSGRDDLANAADRGDDPSYLAPLLAFGAGNADRWEGLVGSEEFRRMFGAAVRKKFYADAGGDFAYLRRISWDFGGTSGASGVVMLTFPHELGRQEGWREAVDFACQLISTITGSFYSSDAWERKFREKVGHELTKTASNLFESVRRLDRIDRKGTSVSSHQHDLSVVRGDLTRHARALSRYTEILIQNREVNDFDADPRSYVIQELFTKWRKEPTKKPTRLRDLYNTSFFGKQEAFATKKIAVPTLDGSLDLQILMDDIALSEVFATLADNILKYTMPGTGLLVRDGSNMRLRGISISNIGLRLDEDELHTVFRDAQRGRLASQELPNQGSGFGLFFAREAMKKWGCGIRHQQRTPGELTVAPGEENRWAWHDFVLLFPKSLII